MSAAGWFALSVAIVALDQLTKAVAEQRLPLHEPVAVTPGFNLFLTYNTGAAFSFLAGAGGWQRWLFVTLSAAISAAIIWWLPRLRPDQRLQACALSLILGGAVGNLVDRVIAGHVIDFIEIYYDRWSWPAFNVADSAISVGAVLLVFDSLRTPGSVDEP